MNAVQEVLSGIKPERTKKKNPEMTKLSRLKWACRFIIAAATGLSIWANSINAVAGDVVSVIISIAPPLLVLAGFELVSRIPLRDNASRINRWARPFATAGIAGIGAYLSYFHQRDAFMLHAQSSTAVLLPLAIDGLMVVASVSLIDLNARVMYVEARESSKAVQVKTKATFAPEPKAKSRVTKKDKVVLAIRRNPDAKPAEIADMVGASANYVYGIMRQLRLQDQDRELAEML